MRWTMADLGTRPTRRAKTDGGGHGGNAVYGLGLVGALVYFWQQADSFGQYLLAVLKSVVWPAFLIYDAFRATRG